MKPFLAVVILLTTALAHAEGGATVTCVDGDYFGSFELTANLSHLSAAICEFGPCSEFTMQAEKNSVDSEGNRKTYNVVGGTDATFVVYFDADATIQSVLRTQDATTVQTFQSCIIAK